MPKSNFRYITKLELVTYREPIKPAPLEDYFDKAIVSRNTLAKLPESSTERQAEKEKVKFLAAYVAIKAMLFGK